MRILLLTLIVSMFISCETSEINNYEKLGNEPNIFPDYTNITIPYNIAPLNFSIKDEFDKHILKIYSSNNNEITVKSSNKSFNINKSKWSKLLFDAKGDSIFFDLYALNKNNRWQKYKKVSNYVSEDSIDSHMAYRLIYPGYILWDKIGLYQRDITCFKQSEILTNKSTGKNCMNCHTFNRNNPDQMMFHMRAKNGGTMLIQNGKITKINLSHKNVVSAGVYPAWHPSGKIIAFSVNKIGQFFHSKKNLSKEVVDFESDIILYNVEKNSILGTPELLGKNNLENTPEWSPDGKYLYYVSAPVFNFKPAYRNMIAYDSIKYNLMRISYDIENNEWGKPEVIIDSKTTNKSYSFPRVASNGRFVLLSSADYGYFTVNNPGSDVVMYDLINKSFVNTTLNSNDVDSFHSWSSNGKWIVFSSKRLNGIQSYPYFAHIGSNGINSKPFLLPQINDKFYSNFNFSFNVPVFIKSELKVDRWKLLKEALSPPDSVKLDESVNLDAITGATRKVTI